MLQQFATVPLSIVTVLLISNSIQAEDWTRFRGQMGSGISTTAAPVKWSPSENLKWKTELPGAGVSCPVVIGNKVLVTCYSGYGLDRSNPGNIEDLKRHLVCVDRGSGKTLWTKTVDAVQPEDPYSGIGVPAHGYASHTPATDGEQVFAFFGKSGVYAFDLDGNQAWHADVGTGSDDRRWGSASSPVLCQDLVIIPAMAESLAIVALDKSSGKEVWRQEADGLRSCWGTPVVVKVDENRDDLVLAVAGEVWGINPNNGKLRWVSTGTPGDSAYTSVSVDNNVIYSSTGGRSGGGSVAIKSGGSGDVSKTNVIWNESEQSGYASPVITNGLMFIVSRGVATSMKAETGERVKKVRLEGNTPAASSGGGRGRFGNMDYSSPVAAGDKLYYVKSSGETFVLSADEAFEQLAVNRVTDDPETFSASPAICDGQIFLRSDKHLYCVEGTQ